MPAKVKKAAPKAAKVPTIKNDDVLVLRTNISEQTFSGLELKTAEAIAKDYDRRGWRVSLIAYTHRATAKKGQKCSVVSLFSSSNAAVSDTEEQVSEVA